MMKNFKKLIYILSMLIISIAVKGFDNNYFTIHFETIQDVIELIQEQKKEGNYQGNSPLHFIADGSYEHELSIAIELIQQGANVNDQDNNTKETPLHLAALWNNLPLVKILIDAGANINAQDEFGRTPLHNIAFYDAKDPEEYDNNIEIAKLLIDNRADLNIEDEDNKTAAMIAFESNNKRLYQMIAEAILLNSVH